MNFECFCELGLPMEIYIQLSCNFLFIFSLPFSLFSSLPFYTFSSLPFFCAVFLRFALSFLDVFHFETRKLTILSVSIIITFPPRICSGGSRQFYFRGRHQFFFSRSCLRQLGNDLWHLVGRETKWEKYEKRQKREKGYKRDKRKWIMHHLRTNAEDAVDAQNFAKLALCPVSL